AKGNVARHRLVNSYGVLVNVRLFYVRIHRVIMRRETACIPRAVIKVLARVAAPSFTCRRKIVTEHRFVVPAVVPFDNGLLIPPQVISESQTWGNWVGLVHSAETLDHGTIGLRYITDDSAIVVPAHTKIQVEFLEDIPFIRTIGIGTMKGGVDFEATPKVAVRGLPAVIIVVDSTVVVVLGLHAGALEFHAELEIVIAMDEVAR